MHAFTATRELSRSARSAMAIGILVSCCSSSGQQIQFGFAQRPTRTELTPPHLETVSGATAARLEQARVLAAGRNWDEAVDIYRELAADKTDRVVALDGSRYVSLRTYCHLQLATLPADGLAAYRRRVDAMAEQWYHEGLASRDEALLRRVVDELFCSSWGDDALMALGELVLERGDYAAARRNWEQISPLLRAPDGASAWQALRDIDLSVKWPEVERRWQVREKPADWLVYPDTKLDLADVRGRLVLTSIRGGEFDRAALQLQIFRHAHPSAAGQLGGQKDVYVSALERLLAAAREWPHQPAKTGWPTFAGSATRKSVGAPLGAILAPIWKEPIKLSPPSFTRGITLVQGGVRGQRIEDKPEMAVRESQRPLSCYPVVVDGVVVFADGTGIRAAQLSNGKPAITADGVLYRNEPANEKTAQVPFGVTGGVASGVPRLTLDLADGIVYSRVGTLATSRAQASQSSAADRIVGLDLRREGLLTFRSPPEDGAWSFDGTPVSDGRRLFVAMRHSDVTPHAYVACFDPATGARRWRTSIGAADTPAGGSGDEITHNLLTLVENQIYFNTNLGLVAALDAESGDICWIDRYDRLAGKAFVQGIAGPLHFDRDPSPCLYHDGLLIVAPSDSPTIFALDADTGKRVWQQNQLPDALHLLCVVGKHLIVSGERVASVDVASGNIDWIWPESAQAGIRGMGRGVVAGNEIFWPTRNQILVLDAKTGAQARSPLELAPLSGGANLVVAHGRLVAAGYDKLTVFGPPATTAPKPREAANADAAVRTGRLSGQSEIK